MTLIDPLDPDKITANLNTKRIGGKVIVYESTSSTNDIAAEYANGKGNDGLVIFAEEQSAGRGRGGNQWLSGRGQSILCSVLLIGFDCSAEMLCLACAVAVAETVGKVGPGEARIKWPNDVRLGGRKVAGILLESRAAGKSVAHIIGVGINCHQGIESFTSELRDSATSIDIESGSRCDRVLVAKRLLLSLDHWISVAQSDSDSVTDRWRELSIQLGHRVKLIFDGKRYSGHCIGIDPQKGLIVKLDRGGVRMFEASHTTVAK